MLRVGVFSLLLCSFAWAMVYVFQGYTFESKARERTIAAQGGDMSREHAIATAGKVPTRENFQELLVAERVLQRIVEQNGQDIEAREAYGDSLFGQKRFDEALRVFQAVAEQNPGRADVLVKIGSTLTLLGRGQEALTALREVVALTPDSFKAHAYLAIALAEGGMLDEGKKEFETALKLAPSDEVRTRIGSYMDKLYSREQEPYSAGSAIKFWARAHPVLGNKLLGIVEEPERVVFRVNNFPLDKMPASMKTSFLAKVWERVSQDIVLFEDAHSGQTFRFERDVSASAAD